MKRRHFHCLDPEQPTDDEDSDPRPPTEGLRAAGRLPVQLVGWVSELAALLHCRDAVEARRAGRLS